MQVFQAMLQILRPSILHLPQFLVNQDFFLLLLYLASKGQDLQKRGKTRIIHPKCMKAAHQT
jgi:hypothetical protein